MLLLDHFLKTCPSVFGFKPEVSTSETPPFNDCNIHSLLTIEQEQLLDSMTNAGTAQLEVSWRVFEASSTRILTCWICPVFRRAVEVRVGYFVDTPLHSEAVTDIESARALAQAWLDALRTPIASD